MSEPGAEPVVQRPCEECGVTDGLPRNQVTTGGRTTYFHLDCDPHPDIDESTAHSQLRKAMTVDPTARTPDLGESLTVHSVDCSDPANHYAPLET